MSYVSVCGFPCLYVLVLVLIRSMLLVGSDWIKADDWMLVLRKRIKRVHLFETLNIHTYDIIYKGSA